MDRLGLSLYDAQYNNGQKVPIPEATIKEAVAAMVRFQRVCHDFGVPPKQIVIIATEATRVAINSEEYRGRIKKATGWDVTMLPKEIEGRTGAYGVASSFPSMKSLMMDLGGGSTQITWASIENGVMDMSEAGSVSLPYGAAALTRNITEARQKGGNAEQEFEDSLVRQFKAAVETIKIPKSIMDLQHTKEGLSICLSGGGFRGWGFLCMSQHPVQPYPVPIINGFRIPIAQFENTKLMTTTAREDDDIFRVSERRASQVPAVACLIRCVLKAIPECKTVYFAQGGVREGYLFSRMDNETRAQHPMETCTRPFAKPSSQRISEILLASGPENLDFLYRQDAVRECLVVALAQAMYIHNVMNKDIQAASALRSTTTGIFAAVNGADHEERACLGIMLCERWGGFGALAPSDADFWRRLIAIIRPDLAWWCLYFGRMAAILAQRYPAGILGEDRPIEITSHWVKRQADPEDHEGEHDKHTKHGKHDKKHDFKKALKHDKHSNKHSRDHEGIQSFDAAGSSGEEQVLVVNIVTDEATSVSENFLKTVKGLTKLGKKKNWPSHTGGYKVKTHVTVDGAASATPAS